MDSTTKTKKDSKKKNQTFDLIFINVCMILY